MTTVREILETGLAELDFELLDFEPPPDAVRQLVELSDLLAHWAERINLTAHREPAAIARRLILDAAGLLSSIPRFDSLADLGSGAGFPGLPIAVLSGAKVTLVEAREKRHHFQRAAIRALGLENATPLRGRIEDLEPTPHQAVVAQAVGPWKDVVGWMVPWAEPGGLLVIPAGREAPPSSLHEAAVDAQILRYQVPLGGSDRQIWLARRSRQDSTERP